MSRPAGSRLESQRLMAIQRRRLGLSLPGIADRAARLGYRTAEHALGWTDLGRACGWEVPFHDHLSEVDRQRSQGSAADRREAFRILDRFENRWMPRVRNAIRRFVAPKEREGFEQAFFRDLQQQPEGPQVVGSVQVLLDRVDDVASSDVPGVREALASLETKGLTAAERGRVRAPLEQVQAPAPPPDEPVVAPQVIAVSARARREAYDRLNRGYIDWAEVFRGELDDGSLVRLGLVRHKGGRPRLDAVGEGGPEAPGDAPVAPGDAPGSPPDVAPPVTA